MPNDDLALGRRQRGEAALELNIVGIEGDGIIVVHLSSCFEAQNVIKVDALHRAMEVDQVVSAGKGVVVLGDVSFFQEAISGSDGADAVTAQRLNQTILMGAIAALDTAFGLWRVGKITSMPKAAIAR